MPPLSSKLPDVGLSIFAQMTALAHHALAAGAHQYAPMPGLPRLRQAIAAQVARRQPEAPTPKSRAPAWACTWSTAWWKATVAASKWKARWT